MNFTLAVLFTLFVLSAEAQSINYFRQMHSKYAGKWHKTLDFEQESVFYRNDSLIRTENWHEYASFPDDFRIDMTGNEINKTVIYKKDSTYRYQNNQLVSVKTDINPYVFLIGGMYFMHYDSAVAVLRSRKIDPDKTFVTSWKGKKTYVIGAISNEQQVNQIWIDAKNLYLVRVIEIRGENRIDAHMEDQIPKGKGWSETKMTFYINDRLWQLEKYRNIKVNVPLDPHLFTPPPR